MVCKCIHGDYIDTILTYLSTARPIMDGDGRVIAILVGRPKDIKDEEWKQMEKEAVELIEKEQKNFVFTKKQQQHRRGPYPTVSTGVSFGGGQQV
jgi:hypothetical protein